MPQRIVRIDASGGSGRFSAATTLLMTGGLAGIVAHGAVPVELAMALCGLCGAGMALSFGLQRMGARRRRVLHQRAQEQAFARMARRIDRHIPRGALRTAGPHHVRTLSERQFMPVAQSARRSLR